MAKNFAAKISVIIPVYNTERSLSRCLASVCWQTLKEIEILCINDGSTDGSLEILLNYARRDSRIIVLEQENGGVASARNNGLNNASAPYIGFVDSDDFVAPDMFEKMYEAILRADADFVECGAEAFFTYHMEFADGIRYDLTTKGLEGKIDDPDIFVATSDVVWKILFKKEIIKRDNLDFPTGLSICEDSLFVYSYKSSAQKGFYIPENLYMYFCYEDSAMGKMYKKNIGKRILEPLKIIKLYYLYLIKIGFYERNKNSFWLFLLSKMRTVSQYAATDILYSSGITKMRELLEIKAISDLISEKNKSYKGVENLTDAELAKLSFLTSDIEKTSMQFASCEERTKKKNPFMKAVKYLLPYGFVRLVQKYVKLYI